MNSIEDVVTVSSAACSHDLSVMALFAQASLVVKIVIVLLLLSSLWSWTIIFAKWSALKALQKSANRFEESFWNCGSIEAFYDNIKNRNNDPFAAVFSAGMKEWRRSSKNKTALHGITLSDRIMRMMRVTLGREIEFLERHLGFLATVGSTAPFVGLFGTVWGIMNSFESISFEQNTSLMAVAPGIAEALFATALGLIVTIPAVIGYNKISSDINRYQSRLEGFMDEFFAIISRQLDANED